MLNRKQEAVLRHLQQADGSNFVRLVEIAGLNPDSDFKGADLRGVDFGRCNLSGYNFEGADLRGAQFDQADIRGANFEGATVEETVWPEMNQRRHALSALQRRVLESLLSVIRKPSCTGGLVVMPTGTGLSHVIENLIYSIRRDKRLHKTLVLTESSAQRSQLLNLLKEHVPASSLYAGSFVPSENMGGVQVATIGKLKGMLKGHEQHTKLEGIGLVLVIGSPGQILDALRSINMLEPRPIVIGLSGDPVSKSHAAADSLLDTAADKLGGFIAQVYIEEAIQGGYLAETRIESKILNLKEENNGNGRSINVELEKYRFDLASDIAEQLTTRLRFGQVTIICKNTEWVEWLFQYLLDQPRVRNSRYLLMAPARARYLESPDSMNQKHAVLIATSTMALSHPEKIIWASDFVIVASKISSRLSDRIRFQPNRAALNEGLVVDYSSNFTSTD